MALPSGGDTVSSYSYSHIYYIDDLLPEPGSQDYKWGGAIGSTAATTITYSFPTTGSSTYWDPSYSDANEPTTGFVAFTATQKTAFRQALGAWSAVANITFQEITTETSTDVGDIRAAGSAAVTNSQTAAAWAYYPGDDGKGEAYGAAGDIWVDPTYSPNKTPSVGNYGFLTLVHEIGHALGLAHPFKEESSDKYYLPTAEDTRQYSVMSYTADPYATIEPSGPMLYDIAAIQYLYGANMNTATGDDTYEFDAGTEYLEAIWDAGGTDTFDVSKETVKATIDLEDGHFSSIGLTNSHRAAKNNVAIAFGATIENAIGTKFGDLITGNDVANNLQGGDGDDVIHGGDGDDTVDGGNGNDKLYGELGSDSLTGGAGDDYLDGGLDTGSSDTMIGGTGNDTFVVNNPGDTVVEAVGEGTDTITSGTISIDLTSANFTGQEIENITLTGIANLNATGNDLDNVLTGNSGINSLAGGAGDDTYILDNTSDTVVEAVGEGTDLIKSSVSIDLTSPNFTGQEIENITLTGTAALNATGNDLNNVLTGNAAANTLAGGKGDDTYILDNAGDKIVEAAGAGTDLVKSSVSINLGLGAFIGQEIENITLTGTGAVSATGNALNNVITGNAAANVLSGGDGNDTLDGGAGIDSLIGGKGDDTYILDSVGDTVTELASQGDDTIKLSAGYSSKAFSFTIAANVEHLDASLQTVAATVTGNVSDNTISGGSANDTLSGGVGTDTLNGNDGDDILDGGLGADILIGGAGNDTYVIDNPGDTVTEASGEGTDLIKASIDVNLTSGSFAGQYIENVTLLGTAALNVTGNALANVITGNAGANILAGGGGDDIIDGGAGIDTVSYADHLAAGVVVNLLSKTGGGASETDQLLNIENVTGTGFHDELTGNALANVLDGGAGDDKLTGGLGNDTYVVDSLGDTIVEALNGGIDTVISTASTYTLADNVENLTLKAGAGNISGAGNALVNVITGNEGENTLDGGVGADSLIGGLGDDTYVLDNIGDKVTELAGGGNDTIDLVAGYASKAFSYVLGATLENVDFHALTFDATATGNAVDNVITGGGGKNTLSGGLGNDTLVGGALSDTLDGGVGADKMTGGAGDDTYIIDNIGDTVTEAAGGGTNDLIKSSISIDLSATAFQNQEIETVLLTGAVAINATGNDFDTSITGNAAANVITGGLGDELLDGGAGIDTVSYANHGSTFVTVNLNLGTAASADDTDTLKNFENVTGSDGNDDLTGNALANVLDGGAGDDKLTGGLGNDTYLVDSKDDTVVEALNGGIDTVISTAATYTLADNVENLTLKSAAGNISGTGNALVNVITGNEGNNKLDGGIGADSLIGGLGDDTYVLDNIGDKVTELAGAGNDTIDLVSGYASKAFSYVLAATLENLDFHTLTFGGTATGNAAVNHLTGGSGDDVLDGGAGADVIAGGLGNDTYVIDNVGDTVTEAAGEGTKDLIKATVNIDLTAGGFVGQEIENVMLLGTAALNVTGNDLDNVITGNAGANILAGGGGNDIIDGGAGIDTVSYADHLAAGVVVNLLNKTGDGAGETDQLLNIENVTGTGFHDDITGNALANVLDGGAGDDKLTGGLGNDTYLVDSKDDTVVEALNGGIDTVISTAATYTLADNVENLTLKAGAGDIDGTGNGLNNIITGNEGENTLDGGVGADSLIGGLGNDTYVLDNIGDKVTELAGGGNDTIDLVSGYASKAFSYVLAATLENLDFHTLTFGGTATGNAADNALTGGSGNDTLTGGAGIDTLTGNDGNDSLDGGVGADILIGGAGDDTYIIDNSGDKVTEVSGGGTDTIKSSVSLNLAAGSFAGQEIENVTLTGAAALSVTGNDLVNTLTGNSGANVLDGGIGADTLIGGAGNDTYIVDDSGDTVTETLAGAAGGIDLVKSSVDFTLGANLENLTLTGTDDLTGTGNALNNVITGNSGKNTLAGGAGNDMLIGGADDDNLTGGAGIDTFVFDLSGFGQDTITDFDKISDHLSFTHVPDSGAAGVNLSDLIAAISSVTDNGAGLDVTVDFTGGSSLVFQHSGTGSINSKDSFTSLVSNSKTQISMTA